MKKTLAIAFTVISLSAVHSATAANLLLDFGQTAVADPYLTLSPGHASGLVPGAQTTWNTIASSSPHASLSYGDGSAATGVTLTMGQEAAGGNGIISYSTAIVNTALAGSGGTGIPTKQSLFGSGSIYGDNNLSTAAGRDGFFGGGTATDTGAAIGLRLDGLAAGTYTIYMMGRNTNAIGNDSPMNMYLGVGSSSSTFGFATETAYTQSNVNYLVADYTNQYNSFVDGENHVAITATIANGESLFLAIDGANSAQGRRGFLNMVQVVQVPEASSLLLGALGLLGLARRRR